MALKRSELCASLWSSCDALRGGSAGLVPHHRSAAGLLSMQRLDLARKPPECLEYIVVHELAHLREPHHGEAFQRLMNQVMAQWQAHRRALNCLPLRHEDWGY
ncbi:MAG: M48 family metallopeptidase [Burkholderiales bacterium]|nr:M48 family metallopeptidase [Burkholderiales bacterium]